MRTFIILWLKLTGSDQSFTLEHRIFNGVLLTVAFIQLLNIPFNFSMGQVFNVMIWSIMLVVMAGIYYVSWYKKRYNEAFVYFAIAGHIILFVNYLSNSGSFGPTPLLVVLLFLFLVSLSPVRLNIFWFLSHSFMLALLFYIEYKHRHWIEDAFETEVIRFTDYYFSFVLVLLLVLGLIHIMRKNYLDLYRNARKLSNQVEAQNDGLKELSELKAQLLSVITHDMRGPLLSIKGYYEEIYNSEQPLSADEHNNVQVKLAGMVNHALDLLDTTLAWSKNKVEKTNQDLVSLSIAEIIKNVLKIQGQLATDKGIKIHLRDDDSCLVLSEEGMLNTVFRNLINNAIKFSKQGGRIDIEVKADAFYSHIHISDDGIGMTQEKLDNLFVMGSKSSEGTASEKGSGVGLFLCKKILEEKGGKISVRSEPGKGSCFTISIPLDASESSDLDSYK